jgi:hypothetical protein
MGLTFCGRHFAAEIDRDRPISAASRENPRQTNWRQKYTKIQ